MTRRFIRQGDKTDHDGVVIDGIENSSLQGQPLSYVSLITRVPASWSVSHSTVRPQSSNWKKAASSYPIDYCTGERTSSLLEDMAASQLGWSQPQLTDTMPGLIFGKATT
jgi:hypothetical protein